MRSVTTPTRRPSRMTGRRRMSCSFITCSASMIVAPASMVIGLRVIQSLTLFLSILTSHAEEGFLDVGIIEKVRTGAGQHDAAGLQHVRAMGDPQRLINVLLDEENGHALLVDLF